MILALDTSGDELLVVLLRDGGLAGCATRTAAHHQEHVIEAIEAALTAAGVGIGEVDGLAVVNGPGSHTGLRVGLATAAGIAYARRLTSHPISSLAVAAQRAAGEGPVLAIVNAGRGRVHAQLHTGHGQAGEAQLVELDGLATAAQAPIAGDAALMVRAAAAGLPLAPTRDGCAALLAAALAAVGAGQGLAYDQLRGTYA